MTRSDTPDEKYRLLQFPDLGKRYTFRQSKDYALGKVKAHYPVPATIGFLQTRCGVYLFDTRTRIDGMPLFKGYTWKKWND